MGRHVASGVEERGGQQNHCWGRLAIKFLEKRKRSGSSSLGRRRVETLWRERWENNAERRTTREEQYWPWNELCGKSLRYKWTSDFSSFLFPEANQCYFFFC